MTDEERELSKKILHAQEKIIGLLDDNKKIFFAMASLIDRIRKLEVVVEAMCVGKGGI